MLQDIRFALRLLAKSPGFTAAAVLTMALGIGVNTAIFSFVYAVLLRPLPFADPDRIETVWTQIPGETGNGPPATGADFIDWREQARSFDGMAAFHTSSLSLTGAGEPIRLLGARAPPGIFEVLGVQPATGRRFRPEEENAGAAGVDVLTHGLWHRIFAGDPNVLGKWIRLSNEPFTVVGIMPASFDFPMARGVEIVVPRIMSAERRNNRRANYLTVLARRKPDVSEAQAQAETQAQAEMDAIAARLAKYHRPGEPVLVRLTTLKTEITSGWRPALYMLSAVVALVLLIACANVANLLLARAVDRRREVAIRRALGLGRARIVSQFLTESLLLSIAGGALGVLFAMWGVSALQAAFGRNLALFQFIGTENIAVNGLVLGVTLLVAIASGILFGLALAIGSARTDLALTLRQAGARGGTDGAGAHARALRASAEIAIALLIGAALFLKSFLRLRAVDPGFNPERLVTAQIALPNSKYGDDRRIVAF